MISFINSMIPQPTPEKKAGCGCGGSCGGKKACADCSTSCDINNSRYPDGRGGCLSFSRKKQIEQAVRTNPEAFMRASENTLSANVNMFGVYEQTVFDVHNRAMDSGDVPPASPFLTPI